MFVSIFLAADLGIGRHLAWYAYGGAGAALRKQGPLRQALSQRCKCTGGVRTGHTFVHASREQQMSGLSSLQMKQTVSVAFDGAAGARTALEEAELSFFFGCGSCFRVCFGG